MRKGIMFQLHGRHTHLPWLRCDRATPRAGRPRARGNFGFMRSPAGNSETEAGLWQSGPDSAALSDGNTRGGSA